MVKISSYKSFSRLFLVTVIMSFCGILPLLAGNLNLKYEQVVTDRYGNELGYRTKTINSIDDLPAGSQWRDYLNTKLQNGKTIYEYASSISKSLSKDLNFTISDRDSNSYSCKESNGYAVNIYNYVNDFASDSSKSFLFMHEFGHVTMLNSYPRSYDFTNLDYGSDNRHYLDEILPNYNTAWVEGWANAFAAANNNGMVFSYDLKNPNSLAFLKENNFDEMSRNELFVAKVLYDSFKDIKGGQAAAYDVFARTSPHYSLEAFCQRYVQMYPQNKVGLAKILIENSYGKITLKELLGYVNGGSYTVTKELYALLKDTGLLDGTATNNYMPSNTQQIASNNSKTSFWSRIANFFRSIFGKRTETVSAPVVDKALGSKVVTSDEEIYNKYTDGTIYIKNSVSAPEVESRSSCVTFEGEVDTSFENGDMSIAEAQELYYKYFSKYNELMASNNSNTQEIVEIRNKMIEAKNLLKRLKEK